MPLLLASVLMLAFWVAGTRAVFALRLELRANWIFRIIPIGGVPVGRAKISQEGTRPPPLRNQPWPAALTAVPQP